MTRARARWICAATIAALAWTRPVAAAPAAEPEPAPAPEPEPEQVSEPEPEPEQVNAPEPQPEPEPEPEQVSAPPPVMIPAPPEPIEVDARNYRMVLAGDILIGLSGGGMITMVIGLGMRSDALTQRRAQSVADQPDADAIAKQTQRIDIGTTLAISGGVAAVGLLSSGITLVALGYRRERLRRMNLPRAQLSPTQLGLVWTTSF